MSDKIILTLVKDINEFFDGGNYWQAGLYQQVSTLTSEQALWKPSHERHCIWEIIRHVNFWKTQALANFLEKYPKEDGSAGNWSALPEDTSEDSWRQELERSRALHEELVSLVSSGKADMFDSSDNKSNYLRQMLYHDAYHSGQIGILRVMQGIKPVE